MCNCYSELKEQLLANFTANSPEGSEQFEVHLWGFVFGVTDSGKMTHRSSNEAKVYYMEPKKAGGMKKVTNSTFVRAAFCPFCGEKYEKDAA